MLWQKIIETYENYVLNSQEFYITIFAVQGDLKVKQIIDIFLFLRNFWIGFTESQNFCTQLKHKSKGNNSRLYTKNDKIKIITYFWHIELSPDHNICLTQEFYNVYV